MLPLITQNYHVRWLLAIVLAAIFSSTFVHRAATDVGIIVMRLVREFWCVFNIALDQTSRRRETRITEDRAHASVGWVTPLPFSTYRTIIVQIAWWAERATRRAQESS